MSRYTPLSWITAVALLVGGEFGPRWLSWLGGVVVFGSLAYFVVCQIRSDRRRG